MRSRTDGSERLGATDHTLVDVPSQDCRSFAGESWFEPSRGFCYLRHCVSYAAAADALRSAGDLTGKTIVDISNPVTPDYSALALGFSTSAAEEIQKAGSPRQRS